MKIQPGMVMVPVVTVPRRIRQNDCKFKTSLGHIAKPYLETNKQSNPQNEIKQKMCYIFMMEY